MPAPCHPSLALCKPLEEPDSMGTACSVPFERAVVTYSSDMTQRIFDGGLSSQDVFLREQRSGIEGTLLQSMPK